MNETLDLLNTVCCNCVCCYRKINNSLSFKCLEKELALLFYTSDLCRSVLLRLFSELVRFLNVNFFCMYFLKTCLAYNLNIFMIT